MRWELARDRRFERVGALARHVGPGVSARARESLGATELAQSAAPIPGLLVAIGEVKGHADPRVEPAALLEVGAGFGDPSRAAQGLRFLEQRVGARHVGLGRAGTPEPTR